jgi:NAD(P)-dependent dehydrogenase (short-subunit alcohol dehydrogenase family)
MYQG